MRVIEQHEEQLCTIMHDIQKGGVLEPAVREELSALLEELPSETYQADLECVWDALKTDTPDQPPAPAAKRKAAQPPATTRKGR